MDDKDSSFFSIRLDVGRRAKGRLTFVLGKAGGGGNRMERTTEHGGVLFLFLPGLGTTGSDWLGVDWRVCVCAFFLAFVFSPAQTPGFIITFIIGRIPRIPHYIRLLSMLPCHMPCYLPIPETRQIPV